MLDPERCSLMVVDVQGQLAQMMTEKEQLFDALRRIILGAQLFDIPIFWLEQLPEKLGPTIPEVSCLFTDQQPITKATFSAVENEAFHLALSSSGREQLLITGIESHICVYQSARDLLSAGFSVHPVIDAISSRCKANRELGLRRMEQLGAVLTSVEMALFELQRVAEGDRFRKLIKLVK